MCTRALSARVAAFAAGVLVGEVARRLRAGRGQAWFWTPEWQPGERRADADLAAGRYTVHESDDDFERALLERSHAPVDRSRVPA